MINAEMLNLQIQPLKGGGPMQLTEARMTKTGLETVEGDIQDHFLFAVDATPDIHGDHNFLTQRVQISPEKNLFVSGTSQLALVKPEKRNGALMFHFNEEEIKVPHQTEDDLSRIIPVQLWEFRGKAIEVPIISEWLSDQLKRKVKVARTSGPWNRMSRQNFEKNDNPLRAQDGYPVHAVTWADAEAVFAAIGEPVDPNRFRFQVLLKNVPFRKIHEYQNGFINDVEIRQPKPCGRCEVTGVDQGTGVFSKVKPLAGLARLGVGRWIVSKDEKVHVLGENWLPQGETILKQGDIFQFTDLRTEPLEFEPQKQPR